MNRKRFLIIGFVAVFVGVIVSLQVYRTLQAATTNASRATVSVLVAAHDLRIGSRVGENDVRTITFQVADPNGFPKNIFHDKSGVVGRVVTTAVDEGDLISAAKLADRNAESGLTSLIPPGMRAFPVRANDVQSIAGFVVPGSRVDVLLTGQSAAGPGRMATTILQDAKVLATDQHLDREPSNRSQPNVITLLVSLEDAQKLALATTEGHIQLVLRNPVDVGKDNLGPTDLNKIYPLLRTARPTVKRVSTPVAVPPSYYWIIKGPELQRKQF
jgi:pilus assembly protein CpaB